VRNVLKLSQSKLPCFIIEGPENNSPFALSMDGQSSIIAFELIP
jgi:hypothetical protein